MNSLTIEQKVAETLRMKPKFSSNLEALQFSSKRLEEIAQKHSMTCSQLVQFADSSDGSDPELEEALNLDYLIQSLKSSL